MNPMFKASITTIVFTVALLFFWYLKDVIIDKGEYHPNMLAVGVLALLVFASELYFDVNKKK